MEGYAKIAHLMGNHGELAILRRFGRLNFQNLLYMQAKLTHLEKDLNDLVQADKAEPDRSYYSKDWWSLARSRRDNEKKQWKKVLQIRKALKEYNKELSQVARLMGHGRPKPYDLEFLRSWSERPTMGDFPLRGRDRHAWALGQTNDLIALQSRVSSDPFSRWLTDSFIPFFHRILGKRFRKPVPQDPESGICEYDEGHISGVVDVLGTVVASILPIGSIVGLYFVRHVLVRLGLIVVFTAVFSLALAVFSDARRVEVFVASSTFAAVQVVFITSNGNSSTV